MVQFNAQFDGTNICPLEPVSLPKNVRLRVTVQTVDPHPKSSENTSPIDMFDELEKQVGLVEGPSDWAAEHDHYLFGSPKTNEESNR